MAKLSGGLRSSANFRHLDMSPSDGDTNAATARLDASAHCTVRDARTTASRQLGRRARSNNKRVESKPEKEGDGPAWSQSTPKKSSSNWPSKPRKPKKQPHQSHAGHDRAFLIEAACERFAQELASMVEASPPKTPPPPAPAATSTSPRSAHAARAAAARASSDQPARTPTAAATEVHSRCARPLPRSIRRAH